MPDRNASVYEQYKNGRSLNIRDLDLVRDIIAAKHPDYLDTFDECDERQERPAFAICIS